MSTSTRRIDPVLSALVAEGFFSRLSFGLISFALPLYAFHLGLDLAEIGLLASLNMIVAVALKPLAGWAADRIGTKPILVGAIGLRSAVCLLLVFSGSAWQLFAIRALHGVSIALRDPPTFALLADHGGKKAVASAFAWYQTAKSTAGAVGKFAAGVLLGATGSDYPLVFFVAFVLSALPLYVAVRHIPAQPVPAALPPRPSAVVQPAGDGPAEALRSPLVFPLAVLGLLITGTAYMVSNLFPVLATQHAGLSEAAAGSIYAITALLAFSAPAFGWLSDHVNQKLVLSLRGVANTASSLFYLLFPTFAGFTAGRALDDMGKAAFRPAWGALMAQAASFDPRNRARTMSLISLGDDAGEIAGPILAGVLWSTLGVEGLLLTRVALALLAEGYTTRLVRRLRRYERHAIETG